MLKLFYYGYTYFFLIVDSLNVLCFLSSSKQLTALYEEEKKINKKY